VLRLSGITGSEVEVTGLARGEAYVIAVIEEEFRDTAWVEVVEPGQERWRVSVGEHAFSGRRVALDGQGRVYVAVDQPGELVAVDPAGELLFQVAACSSTLSPAVTLEGFAVTGGLGCTQRLTPEGALVWSVPVGELDSGAAVAADGSAVILDLQPADDRPVLLIRVSPEGNEVWRDTLGLAPGVGRQNSAPAIAENGDIYVMWVEEEMVAFRLSRVTADGAIVWTVPLAFESYAAAPALVGERIVLTGRYNQLSVYDTSGALLWERDYDGGGAGSPVVDGDGNIYVLSSGNLACFSGDGTLRWLSPLYKGYPWGAGAPTLLVDGSLLAECIGAGGLHEMCAVDADDGTLLWSSSTGAELSGTPAVAPDGTIYVVSTDYVIALWGNVPPLEEGWPTDGGSMQRQNRR
jgi:outer membrane protein assembly factor BamB